MWKCPYADCTCLMSLVGELVSIWMPVTSFLRVCWQVSPWKEMGLGIEGQELVHNVRQNFLFAHWLLPHCHGYNLISNYWSRSTDSQGQACTVPFKCVLFCIFLHEDLYLRGGECLCNLHFSLSHLSKVQMLTQSLFFPSYPFTCVSFLQVWLFRSPSASFQLVFSEDCSPCICIFDVFIRGDKLHVFYSTFLISPLYSIMIWLTYIVKWLSQYV